MTMTIERARRVAELVNTERWQGFGAEVRDAYHRLRKSALRDGSNSDHALAKLLWDFGNMDHATVLPLTGLGPGKPPPSMATITDDQTEHLIGVVEQYRKLHDGVSDMIEEGRLVEDDIPDDYLWLVETLASIAGADPEQ